MNYKRFMRNSKAISPIFATLILIAIAVIAGVVVYMFTSGTLATMTSGGTAGQEKITVQAASISSTSGLSTVYVEQTSGPAATVNSLIVKDSSGATLGVITTLTGAGSQLVAGTLTQISGTYGGSTALVAGQTYSITVTTKAGGSFVSSQVPAS